MTLDLDDIEAKAQAAPAGPWRLGQGKIEYGAVVCDVDTGINGGNDPEDVEAYGGHLVGESMARPTREFLVAANPAVVLELVRIAREAAK